MVLSLKPFGCMPSSQSDGVQSAVINRFKDMIFLPIETSGEGEINAHSRVQMALGEAKAKARLEFEQALESTGKSLDDIRALRRRASRSAAARLSGAASTRGDRHGRRSSCCTSAISWTAARGSVGCRDRRAWSQHGDRTSRPLHRSTP